MKSELTISKVRAESINDRENPAGQLGSCKKRKKKGK